MAYQETDNQHDHYTGAPCAKDNKRPLKCAHVVTQCQRCLKLREFVIGMLTAGMSTRAVAREFNIHFSTISILENLAVPTTGFTTADHV